MISHTFKTAVDICQTHPVMVTNSKFAAGAGAVFLLYNSAGAGYFSYNSAGFEF